MEITEKMIEAAAQAIYVRYAEEALMAAGAAYVVEVQAKRDAALKENTKAPSTR